jgi:hypothetical protein
MWMSNQPRETLSLATRCYRLTDAGRACVDIVESEFETIGSLSRHLHDVLMMCGSGMWFEQLRQFMPPRSLEESLRALLNLGLIEVVHTAGRNDMPRREEEQQGWMPAFTASAHQSLAQLPA